MVKDNQSIQSQQNLDFIKIWSRYDQVAAKYERELSCSFLRIIRPPPMKEKMIKERVAAKLRCCWNPPFYSHVFFPFFLLYTKATQHIRIRLGQKPYRSVSRASSACLHENGTERNDCVSFHFSYHFFNRSTFWNGTMLLKRPRMNAAPERSIVRKGTIWKRTIVFPCDRGLSCIKNTACVLTRNVK